MNANRFEKFESLLPRGVEKQCQICSKSFGALKRQHQCKRCLRAICSDCGSEKITVFKQEFVKNPHRGCPPCRKQNKQMEDYIQANHLCFGKMSDIGNKWLKKIVKRPPNYAIGDKKLKKLTKEMFDRMWNAYNYTVRQFIGFLTFDYNQADIYKTLNDVFECVISAAPDQRIEDVGLIAIFLLCFCSPDKAAVLCLYLIDLKNMICDQENLVKTYLKALGLSEQIIHEMKPYISYITKKYISSLSINSTNIKSSIYLIDQVVARKKIDEIYMFLCLSIELQKKAIVLFEDNFQYCDLLITRNCSIEATSIKYKLVGAVKISNFLKDMKELKEDSFSEIKETSFMKDNKKILNGAISIEETTSHQIVINELKEQLKQSQINPFRRKNQSQQQSEDFTQDSFSMISMIEQNKDLGCKRETHEILDQNMDKMMMNTELIGNLSDDSNNILSEMMEEVNKSNQSANESNHSKKGNSFELKWRQDNECELCIEKQKEIDILKTEKSNLQKCRDRVKQLQKENKELRQASKKIEESYNFRKKQLAESQLQLNKYKESIIEYQMKQKDFEREIRNIEEQRKHYQKIENELKSAKKTFEESQITIKMLRNQLQNSRLSLMQQSSGRNSEVDQILNMNNMLKNSLKQKNQQLEDVMKKNKLLTYQFEESSRTLKDDKQKNQLIKKNEKLEKEKSQILKKMSQLSILLMQEEGQKINLSEENFTLRQILKENKIRFSNP